MSAVIVVTSPIASFTASFESPLRWCSGKSRRMRLPSHMAPSRIVVTKPATSSVFKKSSVHARPARIGVELRDLRCRLRGLRAEIPLMDAAVGADDERHDTRPAVLDGIRDERVHPALARENAV